MIKLIASDMDGTLLNDQMTVSDANAQAIKAAQAAGIEFMVATGRGLTEAKPLVTEHDLQVAFITLNGAQVYATDGQLTVEAPLTEAQVQRIMSRLDADTIYYEVVTNQGIFSNSKPRRVQNVADLLVDLNPDTPYKMAVALASARLELMNINYVADYQKMLQQPGLEVMKIIAFTTGQPDILKAPQADFAKDPDLAVTSSAATNIEINHTNAQKGIALAAYAKQKGISMDEVMTLGDNLNDASMIKMAKYGVAMGNAVPSIKALAWHVTGTNVEDGVAQAIHLAIAQNEKG